MKTALIFRITKLLYYLFLVFLVSFCIYWGLHKEPISSLDSKTSQVDVTQLNKQFSAALTEDD